MHASTHLSNPKRNMLPPGVSQASVLEAVDRSGYPLQPLVALAMERFGCHVTEEWAFQDEDSGTLRTLDIRATRLLLDPSEANLHVRPNITFLVECKQSELPYVFFLSPERANLFDYPSFAGIRKLEIEITTDDSPSTWTASIPRSLNLSSHPFVTEPPRCFTFSKAVWKNKDLELSGSDPFQGLVLPLVKAMKHFVKTEHPIASALYFDLHAVIGLGLLDAPMVAVVPGNAADSVSVEMVPWVRVLRHELLATRNTWFNLRRHAVDLIHKDFLDTYLNKIADPFAGILRMHAVKHQIELQVGKGFATSMNVDGFSPIEPRLKPRTMSMGWKRQRIVAQNLLGQLIGREPMD